MTWLWLSFVACTPELLPEGWGNDGTEPADVDRDGHVADDDCDDGDPAVHPGAAEICDHVDQDCDTAIDEGVQHQAWPDIDGDGWGSNGDPWVGCETPTGTTDRTGDCNDGNAAIHPDADELCNGADDDCDGQVDEEGGLDGELWYADQDGDGYGPTGTGEPLCDPPDDAVDQGGDCDDDDPARNPGQAEIWYDGVDSDCDGADDYDADQDGYDVSLDCDDLDASLSPGVDEICGDGLDNDCDGGAASCALEGDFPLSSAPATVQGTAAGSAAGTTVCGPGDLDGDGRQDLVIGAPGASDGAAGGGAVAVFLPPVSGVQALDAADALWLGDTASAQAGAALSGAGDHDGDGQPDLLIGGPGADLAWLVAFAGGNTLLGADGATMLVGPAGSEAGMALAGGDDHTGDGVADLWVGAPVRTHGGKPVGGVFLVEGPVTGDLDLETDTPGVLVGESSYDRAGAAIATLGDVDGDGLSDLVVGAPQDDAGATDGGAAYLVLTGSPIRDLADAETSFRGTATTGYLGAAVAGPGDLDGDGLADVVVGMPGADEGSTNNGMALIWLGGASGQLTPDDAHARLVGEDSSDEAGSALATPGDFDGDGTTDLVIGADRQGMVAAYGGAAYVVLGPVSGVVELVDAHARLQGEGSYDYAGASVAGVGDPDWDGRRDLLVGAPGDDAGGSDAGAAWLVLASGM